MRRISIILLALTLFASLNAEAARKKARHVVLIGIDGWAAEAVRRAPASDIPNIRYLMENGSWTLAKRSVMPSASAINWTSMFNGLPTEMHGFDKWNSTKGSIPSTSDNGNGIPPTIFTVMRQQRPSAELGCVYDWGCIGILSDSLALDYNYFIKTYRGKETIIPTEEYTKIATDYIKDKKPDLLVFYYGALDNAGHQFGWYGPEYMECQKSLDRGVGMVIQALKDAGIFDDTIIIMSSDHGGKDKGHGGFTMLELETPFIVFGNKVKKGNEFQEPMMQYDTAATIAYILGLDIPEDWRGKPLKRIFK
ncbi:MAG: alkaline phosphatase [Bacteroidales bacterium]|nr:alkaline phosphatase [Bacteroidales bacterium]